MIEKEAQHYRPAPLDLPLTTWDRQDRRQRLTVPHDGGNSTHSTTEILIRNDKAKLPQIFCAENRCHRRRRRVALEPSRNNCSSLPARLETELLANMFEYWFMPYTWTGEKSVVGSLSSLGRRRIAPSRRDHISMALQHVILENATLVISSMVLNVISTSITTVLVNQTSNTPSPADRRSMYIAVGVWLSGTPASDCRESQRGA